MKRTDYIQAQKQASEMLQKAGIVVTDKERENIEVVDEGLNDLYNTGLQIITYVNTERVCAKELIMFPYQTCPEHRHPAVLGHEGKEETFRVRYGKVFLYVEGEETNPISAKPPKGTEQYYTAKKEYILYPGDQYTLKPNTWHWFQAGEEGAIVSEFSTKSMDETDEFTNPFIERITKIED